MSIVIVGGNEHMERLISVVLSVAKVSVILPSVTNVSVVSFVLSLFVEHADKSKAAPAAILQIIIFLFMVLLSICFCLHIFRQNAYHIIVASCFCAEWIVPPRSAAADKQIRITMTEPAIGFVA